MRRDKIFAAIFIAMIALPFLLALVKPAGGVSNAEKRQLAPTPKLELSIAGVIALPRQIDRWFNDHFGFRAKLARANDTLEYAFLGTSQRVIVGTDGWLFLKKGLRNDVNLMPVVRDLCGDAPLSQAQLDAWVNALQTNRKTLEAQGATYVLMVVPNKHTLYYQHLPPSVACKPGQTRLDQLAIRLNALDNFPWIDLRNTLSDINDAVLFHKTDTHWNANGAIAAYDVLARWMTDKIKFDNLDTETRVRRIDTPIGGGDLAHMAGLDGTVSEIMHGFKVENRTARPLRNPYPQLTTDVGRQPQAFRLRHDKFDNAVIFHDSFVSQRLKHLLAETFSVTRFAWAGNPVLPLEIVQPDHAGIVIHEMVERNLLQPWF